MTPALDAVDADPRKARPMPARVHAIVPAALCMLLALPLGACGIRSSGGPVEIPDPSVQIRQAQDLARRAQEADKSGRKDEAVALYRQAVQSYRDFPAAWNNLAVLLMEQQKNMEAFEAFQVAAELAPTDPRPPANMGMLWQKLGYPGDAGKFYTTALERDPNYLPALRESVLLDTQLDKVTSETANRVRRALQIETDRAWREELMRRHTIIEERLASGKDSGARTNR
jgi:tetratricopeptide (TPR) repeat protein